MSWNLWWRHGPWEQRQQAIAATLAEVQPDLCGFQEVWGGPGENGPGENLAIDLAGRLGMHWCWAEAGKVRDAGGGTELFIGNAILSRWPITSQAADALPVSVSDEARVAVHARIDTPGGALPMFTTHLTWGLGRSALRTAQVRALARFVEDHSVAVPIRPWSPGTSTPNQALMNCGCSAACSPTRRFPAWCSSTPGVTPIRATPASPGTCGTATRTTA